MLPGINYITWNQLHYLESVTLYEIGYFTWSQLLSRELIVTWNQFHYLESDRNISYHQQMI